MELIFPLLIVGFVVLLVTQSRRQRRELKATQEMQSALQVGDRVMTTAGLHATVAGLDEDTVDLEIAPGVVTTWSRLVIRQELTDDAEDTTGDDEDALVDDTSDAGTTATEVDDTRPSLRKS
ncbi:preprotein translocase subunit YajC [Rhodococcus aerolatus]